MKMLKSHTLPQQQSCCLVVDWQQNKNIKKTDIIQPLSPYLLVLPIRGLAHSFFFLSKSNCYHRGTVIYEKQMGPCTSTFQMMNASSTRKGETINLFTKTTFIYRIFYRFIIHVFSLTRRCISDVLHSTADLWQTSDAAHSGSKSWLYNWCICSHNTIIPCQQRDDVYCFAVYTLNPIVKHQLVAPHCQSLHSLRRTGGIYSITPSLSCLHNDVSSNI